MLIRNCFAVPLLAALAASMLSAAPGTIDLRVRDAQTGYAVRTIIKLQGPESLTLQTDDTGHVVHALPTGEYREEYSAAGYKTLRSHFKMGPGAIQRETTMLDRENPPEEERPEVLRAEIRAGFTFFHGYVLDDESGRPLSGVKVRFVDGGVETQTDSKGHFGLSVPTPQPAVPDMMGTETLIYEKPGYRTVIFENFGISGEEMGGIAYGLEKGSGVIRNDATHKLMQRPGAKPETCLGTPISVPLIRSYTRLIRLSRNDQ